MHSVQSESRALAKNAEYLADDACDRDERAEDDVLKDGPFYCVHEVGFGGTVAPAAELEMRMC